MRETQYRTVISGYDEGGQRLYTAEVFAIDSNLLMEYRSGFDDQEDARAWAARATAQLRPTKHDTADTRQLEPTDKEVEAAMWEFSRVLDEWREMAGEPAGNTVVWLKVTDKAMRAALTAFLAARTAGQP